MTFDPPMNLDWGVNYAYKDWLKRYIRDNPNTWKYLFSQPVKKGSIVYLYPQPRKARKVATVNICDRCAAFGKDEVFRTLFIDAGTRAEKELEICSACRAELDSWMLDGTGLREGKSVLTPYQQETPIDPQTAALLKMAAQELAKAQANQPPAIGAS